MLSDEYEYPVDEPGEPQPWGVVKKDPYKLIRQDVDKLVRAKIITQAEARYSLGLPPLPPPPPLPAPALRPMPTFAESFAGGLAFGRSLFAKRKRKRRARAGGGAWERAAFRLLEHKSTGRH